MSTLTERIEAEAATATRPGQYARLTDIATEVQRLTDERDRLKRGGKALGDSLKFWMDLAVEVTGSQDCIEEDGDGDWGAVAERLAELGALRHRVIELSPLAGRIVNQTTACVCPDEPHQNAMHDLAHDMAAASNPAPTEARATRGEGS